MLEEKWGWGLLPAAVTTDWPDHLPPQLCLQLPESIQELTLNFYLTLPVCTIIQVIQVI